MEREFQKVLTMVDETQKGLQHPVSSTRKGVLFQTFVKGAPQRDCLLTGSLMKMIQRYLPDPSWGLIDNPQKGYVIIRIDHETQVSECFLDLFPVIETDPSNQFVGNLESCQGFF